LTYQRLGGDEVSAAAIQTLTAGVLSLLFLAVIHSLGRRQKLSFRYTVGWLILGSIEVLAGLLVPLTKPIADLLHVQPVALLAIGAMVLLLLLAVQLSISISGLQEQARCLAEEAAYLRREIDELRRDRDE